MKDIDLKSLKTSWSQENERYHLREKGRGTGPMGTPTFRDWVEEEEESEYKTEKVQPVS